MYSESNSQSVVDREHEGEPPRVPLDELKSWHQQYTAEDGASADFSGTFDAVMDDALDYGQIETQVQQLIPTTVVINGFCAECQYLLDHWPVISSADGIPVGRQFHTNELEAAARQGCRFCALLLAVLEERVELAYFQRIEARLRAVGDDATALLSISARKAWSLRDGLEFERQFIHLHYPGKRARTSIDYYTPMVVSDFLPPSANLWEDPVVDPFEIAKMWLTRCSKSHKCCRSTKQHRPPTRLISIGHGVVKLVITTELPTPPLYATLSYCWGSGPFTTLTRDNLDLFMNHLPLSGLPRTFIDAIDVARRLGIEHIWIDALCIIQKEVDNSDWTIEASYMSDVYGGTLVNLAASTATSVHQGFINNARPKHRNWGFVAHVTTKAKNYCRVQTFRNILEYKISTSRTHLVSRAWTLQERVLSPRTIYFGKSGLFWTCRAHLASESLPGGWPSLPDGYPLVEEHVLLDWTNIVEDYSKARLTYGSDRLPALSGIAARQQQVTGDQYLAGLWKESLIPQLLWELRSKRSHRPEWRAPTWSWASVDCGVRYFRWRNGTAYIQVKDAWTQPSGPDPYGAVANGELTLYCTHLFRAQIKSQDCSRPGSMEMQVDGVGRVAAWGERSAFCATMDCLEEELGQDQSVAYILPVIKGEPGESQLVGRTFTRVEHMLSGLILQAGNDYNEPSHFQRIGSFRVRKTTGRAESEELYQAFMDVLEKDGSSVAAHRLGQTVPASENQNGRITIVIK